MAQIAFLPTTLASHYTHCPSGGAPLSTLSSLTVARPSPSSVEPNLANKLSQQVCLQPATAVLLQHAVLGNQDTSDLCTPENQLVVQSQELQKPKRL